MPIAISASNGIIRTVQYIQKNKHALIAAVNHREEINFTAEDTAK